MSLLGAIRSDVRQILGNGGDFGIPITFISPDQATVSVIGTAKKHHIAYDDVGNVVNSRQASVTICEQDLTVQGYPVRNAKQEVYLKHHTVRWADAQGTMYRYKIDEAFPDEHLGIIVLILSHAVYEP